MTTLREAAQMALEALEFIRNEGRTTVIGDSAIEALREALEQPEQEPVNNHVLFDGVGGTISNIGYGTQHTFEYGIETMQETSTTKPSNNGNWRHVCIKFNDQPPCGANFSQKDLLDRWSKDFQVYLDGKPADIYTAPPQREWQGLTDEEIENCFEMSMFGTCRAIETKLKEKNGL